MTCEGPVCDISLYRQYAEAADSWHNCSKNVTRCRFAHVERSGYGWNCNRFAHVPARPSVDVCAPGLRPGVPPAHYAFLPRRCAAVLLVGPLVLAPAGYELSLLFACASVFLSVASWMTRRSGGDSAKGPVTDGKRAVRWLANGITVLALSASILVAGFECLLAVPYIAEPTGPAGDRVVVVERNVLLAGYGDVYLVSGGFGVGRKIASYSADDGYSPMDNGTYALEWRGSEPHFTAYGTPANPVVMYPAD